MSRRCRCSDRRLKEHFADPFVRGAREDGCSRCAIFAGTGGFTAHAESVAAALRGRRTLAHGTQCQRMDVIDQPRSMYLAELALDMSHHVLKEGGGALIKVFQGCGCKELVDGARKRFGRVRLLKPQGLRLTQSRDLFTGSAVSLGVG